MKRYSKFLFFYFMLFLTIESVNDNEHLDIGDQNIQDLHFSQNIMEMFEDISVKTKSECGIGLLNSFGLIGNEYEVYSTNRYCPMIFKSCCSLQDERISSYLWNRNFRPLLENHYSGVLNLLKFILGFFKNFNDYAKILLKNSDPNCQKHAENFLHMRFTKKIIYEIYDTILNSIEYMGKMRKGFFCGICDGENHKVDLKDTISINLPFCQKLVDNTSTASYYFVHYVKNFIDSSIGMLQCHENIKPDFLDLPLSEIKDTKFCHFFQKNNFFFYCENYCQMFHNFNISSILEGNFDKLQKVALLYIKYSSRVLDTNLYIKFLDEFMDKVESNHFHKEKDINKVLSYSGQEIINYKTNIVYLSGMDLLSSFTNSKYPLTIESSKIFGILLISVIFLLNNLT